MENSNIFLHNHLSTEIKLNVGIGHVIVDKHQWEATMAFLSQNKDIRDLLHEQSYGDAITPEEE